MIDEADYTEVQIRVRTRQSSPTGEEIYPVEITLFAGDDEVVFREGTMGAALVDNWLTTLDGREDGRLLFDLLLADANNRAAWNALRGDGRPRRICLRIDDERVRALPWETLAEPLPSGETRFLAAAAATPFSRYMPGDRVYPAPVSGPVNMLVAMAIPNDLPEEFYPVEIAAEQAALTAALVGLRVQPVFVPQPCTLAAIEAHLNQGNHILHLLAHGTTTGDGAALLLADADGQTDYVTPEELAGVIARTSIGRGEDKGLRLVVLASCRTAQLATGPTRARFVPALIEAGVPAVIAMQDDVSVNSARRFSQVFYPRLLNHGRIDLALNEARAALVTGAAPDALVPQLTSAQRSGKLLAADPKLAAARRMAADPELAFFDPARGEYLRLPVEVAHYGSGQEFRPTAASLAEHEPAVDLMRAVRLSLAAPPEDAAQPGRLSVILGTFGSNRSTQMRAIAWETLQATLQPQAPRTVLPVCTHLHHVLTIPRRTPNVIFDLIYDALLPYWPDLTIPELRRRLDETDGFRLLIDNSAEVLDDAQDAEYYRHVVTFIKRYPHHEYLLAADVSAFKRSAFEQIALDVMVIQPLERRKVRHFLSSLPKQHPGQLLLQHLERNRLFDLAAVPWFLVRMIRQAESAQLPRSRADVIGRIYAEMLGKIDRDESIRAHAERVLQELGWQMQRQLTTSVEIDTVFTIMRDVRRGRDYHLEELLTALLDTALLRRVGQSSLRFGHPRFQAYCCAQAIVANSDVTQVLSDITAGLGRIPRLRWWEETIVLVCGLLDEKSPLLRQLLEQIVYGVNLLDSDQTFLAARCLLESRSTYRGVNDLAKPVSDALFWRLNNRNESRSSHRSQAADLLGQLLPSEALPTLAHVAYGKPRVDRRGSYDYDYSNVRMAAVVGLLATTPQRRASITQDVSPILLDVLKLWQRRDAHKLIEILEGKDIGAQGIAALALGDLFIYCAMADEKDETCNQILQSLKAMFLATTTEPPTLWAIAYALSLVDPTVVLARVILPFLDAAPRLYRRQRTQRLLHEKAVAYLIGLLRTQTAEIETFLVDYCLGKAGNVQLAAIALNSLGRIGDTRPARRKLLEEVALGRFEQAIPPLARPTLRRSDKLYLQRRATEALATVGNRDTITALRNNRWQEETPITAWDPALEYARYRTSEEIFWRLYRADYG